MLSCCVTQYYIMEQSDAFVFLSCLLENTYNYVPVLGYY